MKTTKRKRITHAEVFARSNLAFWERQKGIYQRRLDRRLAKSPESFDIVLFREFIEQADQSIAYCIQQLKQFEEAK